MRLLRPAAAVAGGACVVLLGLLAVLKQMRPPAVEAERYAAALESANAVDAAFIACSIVFWTGLAALVAERGARRTAAVVVVLIALASGLDVWENQHRVLALDRGRFGTVLLESSLWATYLAAAAAGIALRPRGPRWFVRIGLLGPAAGFAGLLLGFRPAVLLWLVAWHAAGAVVLSRPEAQRS